MIRFLLQAAAYAAVAFGAIYYEGFTRYFCVIVLALCGWVCDVTLTYGDKHESNTGN